MNLKVLLCLVFYEKFGIVIPCGVLAGQGSLTYVEHHTK